ncbi:MAG: hypothetical protein KAY24_03460 [Candidatus Eisenbacteria sp.]|nr:hypothetical protein [Candidatus Eisenbacteria bacterium]
MPQSTTTKILSRIYGKGRGWAFSSKDFSGLGTRSAIDVALYRLHDKGTIRRVIRGVYDYPKHSKKLGRELSPDIDQAASALARKFGWRIQATGPAALNLLGLSTQVMGRLAYLSDGPDRTYAIGNQTIVFQHTTLKEAGFKLRESSLVVQALKSLGPERIDEETISRLRHSLGEDLCARVLKDTRTARGWIHDMILKICRGEQ